MTTIGVKEFKSSDDITDWLNKELQYYKVKIINIETIKNPDKIVYRVWYQVE